MGTRRDEYSDNPLKRDGMSKEKTQRVADQADPKSTRTPAAETATGQGGSRKGGGQPDVDHPSQKGGVKEDLPEHEDAPARR